MGAARDKINKKEKNFLYSTAALLDLEPVLDSNFSLISFFQLPSSARYTLDWIRWTSEDFSHEIGSYIPKVILITPYYFIF